MYITIINFKIMYTDISKEAQKDIKSMIRLYKDVSINEMINNITDELMCEPTQYKFNSFEFLFYIAKNYTITK